MAQSTYLEVTEKSSNNMLLWSFWWLSKILYILIFSSELNYFVGSISVSSKTQLPSTAEERHKWALCESAL